MIKKIQWALLSSLVMGAVIFSPVMYDLDGSPAVVFAAESKDKANVNKKVKVQTYTGVGEYIGSNGDSSAKSKQRAIENAEHNALEQAGVFVSNNLKNFKDKLTKDEIAIAAGGVSKATEVKLETIPLKTDYIKYRATVTVQIDTEKFEQAMNRFLNRDDYARSVDVNQYETLKKLNDEQAKRIKELEIQIVNADTQQQNEQVKKEYSAIVKDLIYIQNLEAANKSRVSMKYKKAVNAYNETIALNSTSDLAYLGRAYSYYALETYKQAIEDYTMVIKINPNYSEAYKGRGIIYDILKDYKQAIADYTKAIQINPNDMCAYRRRGILYYRLDDSKRGSADMAKVKELTEAKSTEAQK